MTNADLASPGLNNAGLGAAALNLAPTLNVAVEYIDGPVCAGHGARHAYLCDGESLTYDELREQVDRAGNAFARLGIERGQRVAILLPNRPEFVVAFFGAIKIGALPAPISYAVTVNDHAALLSASGACAIVTTPELWRPLRERQLDFPSVRHVVLTVDAELAPGEFNFAALLAAASDRPAPALTHADEAAFWLHTSGSTGTPKWAVHLQRSMLYCERLYAAPYVGLRPGDVVLCGTPCFHAYGLGFTTYFALKAGATVVLNSERSTPQRMFDLIRKHAPSILVGVPTLYAQMLHAADAHVDLSSLRACYSAAEPLPAELHRCWRERFGIEILDGLGATETLQTFISNRAGEARPGSTGRVVPGYRVRLIDANGIDVADGEVGDLVVSGGSVFAEYWSRHDLTARVLRDGWYSTGDKYRRDAEGYYWYMGRSDDLLRVSGHWVSPAELEAVLAAHPAVLEAAVVGKRDRDALMKPKAFVVLRNGHGPCDTLAEDLKLHVKRAIASYKYPRWIEFCESLPKTATGKIQRFKLREEASG